VPLQKQAARKLDGIARAERLSEEKRTCICDDLRNHLDNGKGGEVALQGSQHSVAVSKRERPLARPTDDA
jgi:hypothetical protein